MKINVLIGLILLTSFMGFAQQLPQYSQFYLNKSLYNPAALAIDANPTWVATANNKLQWVGINDAPRTLIFNINGPIYNDKMGLGAEFFIDITGPTSRTGISLKYAYNLTLSSSLKLAVGVSGGILQYSLDGSKLTLQQPDDIAVSGQLETSTVANAGFGLHLYSDDYFFGVSMPQILGNQISFSTDYQNTQSALARHLFVYGGYRFHLGEDFILEPMVLAKYVDPAPISLEATFRVLFKNMVWLGASYRLNDAIVPLVGFTLFSNITFAYSYDIPLTQIKTVTSGSHELTLQISFNK